MPDIVKINEGTSYSERKTSKKLSFEKGEVFSAKIVGKSDGNNEVVLKLSDGWQFTAKVDDNSEALQDKSSRFEVVGFEDGKIKIKSVPTEKKDQADWKSSIDDLIKSPEMGLSKEDIAMLKEMIRHDLPLVKENISIIKNLLFCRNQLNNDSEYGNQFILKYLEAKGIQLNSAEGKEIVQKLQNFFNELKGFNNKELLTLFENSIVLNGDNLESFSRLVKGDKTIYDSLKSLQQSMYDDEFNNSNLEMKKPTENEVISTIKDFSINDSLENRQVIKNVAQLKEILNTDNIDNLENGSLFDILSKNPNIKKVIDNSQVKLEDVFNIVKEIKDSPMEVVIFNNIDVDNNLFNTDIKNILNSTLEEFNKINDENNKSLSGKTNTPMDNVAFLKEILWNKDVNSEELVNAFIDSKNQSQAAKQEFYYPGLEKKLVEIFENIKNDPKKAVQELNANESLNKVLTKLKEDILQIRSEKPLAEVVKNEISIKLDDIKNIIKTLIQDDNTSSQELINMYKDSFKDFNVFNDLSNKYYMIDVPVNVNRDLYDCKLLIKDERKKGKKIDSRNVKIVASVKTINMGKVDSYIYVKDISIIVDIKSEEKYVGILSKYKDKIINSLDDLGYIPKVDVTKKIEDANIVTTREFFDDNKHVGINIKV